MPIYVPTEGTESWRRLLADPVKHWAEDHSAMAVAQSWEAARGLPPEITALLAQSFDAPELLAAFPEHQVHLDTRKRPSQNDVFAIVRDQTRTIAMAVEGKVKEPFGDTVAAWLQGDSGSRQARLHFLRSKLGLETHDLGDVRYQLLHRTASAMIEAERFRTDAAAMVVQSFAANDMWLEDFQRFVALFGDHGVVPTGRLVRIDLKPRPLFLGWAKGDARFLNDLSRLSS
ncbi:MAG: hypothetical protein QM698_10040 [Micropepsaceae bacterium]